LTKKRATDVAISGYIRLPKAVRRFTDPLVQGHASRSEKGKESVKKAIKGRRRRRR